MRRQGRRAALPELVRHPNGLPVIPSRSRGTRDLIPPRQRGGFRGAGSPDAHHRIHRQRPPARRSARRSALARLHSNNQPRVPTQRGEPMDIDTDINDRGQVYAYGAPETKSGIADGDRPVTHDEVMRIYHSLRAANDERLDAIERHAADVVHDEKVDRINADLSRRIDDLALRHARPALERSGPGASEPQREHKAAFDAYLRRGESDGLRALEVKAMSVGSNPDGGYTVPP